MTTAVPGPTIGALLFDLDGTLVDSDALHLKAFNALLAEEGREISQADFLRDVQGQPNTTIMQNLFPKRVAEHTQLSDRKEELFRSYLAADVPAVHGINDLLDWARTHRVAVAVVTNAPRANADAMLAAAGLSDAFSTVVCGDELARAKPDPLPYQTAMQLLGVTPSRSIAFEDSAAGMRAASASGARAIGMLTSLSAKDLQQAGALLSIEDFTAPELWRLLETLLETAA